ncbi:MAG: DGQHR domain-containing protein [Proteobacteria bacterium]|nr:DGQHR domain-containing protein [Pseudomonadota bacterium]
MKKITKVALGENNAQYGPLLLPAVKGKMGNREYLLCPMPAEEVAKRIMLASELIDKKIKEIAPSEKLQREVNKKRLSAIAKYLKKDHRFFNAFVIALCGDTAKWRAITGLKGEGIDTEKHGDSLGFLSLTGEEQMYALDGQHRLLGIREAIKLGQEEIKRDQVTLLIVHHDGDKHTNTGFIASRRLFTALNKYAEKIAKSDAIFLDEDDIAALVVRKLVEDDEHLDLFALRNRVHLSPYNQFYAGVTTTCYTTIGILYDCVMSILVVKTKKQKSALSNWPEKIDESDIYSYASAVHKIFKNIRKYIPEFEEYFNIKVNSTNKLTNFVMEKNKQHVLFRPMGLKCFVQTICRYQKNQPDKNIEEIIEICSKLPFALNESPLAGLVWDAEEQKIKQSGEKGFTILKGIYCYLLGLLTEKEIKKLKDAYKKILDDETATLPQQLWKK